MKPKENRWTNWPGFHFAFNSVTGHFCLLRTGHRPNGRLLSPSQPFCLSTLPYFSVKKKKLGLGDSETVCSDCWWCYSVNINHKCKRRWGCVSFFYLPFPLPFSSTLILFPVVLTLPTFVVPVHSIRLEYGCVVVDTCTVRSVSQCCRAKICLLLVMPSNAKQWRQELKGATQVP